MLGQGLRRRTHCALRAPFKQLRQVSARSACVLRHTHAPLPCASRHAQKGTPNGHPHGPLLRSAPSRGRKRHALRRRGRAQRWPEWMLAARLSHPCWLRLRRGGCGVSMGVEAPMLRELTRRGCPSGARQRKASSTAHPATATTEVCPGAQRRGRRLGVAFSLVTFFWRSKRKLLACRATPGSRTQHGHAVATAQKHRQAQPERMGWCPGFDKLSPNGSGKTREL